MEKIKYPSQYMKITQGYMEGTHAASYAIDEAGSDSGIDFMVAPFTGTIKKIYTPDANEVWLESNDKVLFADGTIDYATIMMCHDNDVSNLYVGQVIGQGQRFYEEGTKGFATGNHVHMEIAQGKFTGTGWHQNEAGYWSLNNAKKPEECYMIDDTHIILNNYGYNFKHVNEVQEPQVDNGVRYLNLYSNIDTWRVYPMNVAPVGGNECNVIKPSKFGGLSYTIHGYTMDGVAIIETRDFGQVQIYIGAGTEGKYSITENPVYGLVK